MPKERVVVFDGEDKFIAPRNTIFDAKTGIAEQVGVDGDRNQQIVFEGQPQSGGTDSQPKTPAGSAFEDYMRRQNAPVVMPVVGEPNFCQKMQTFIQTRGQGRATPEQIMQAYQLFQENCNKPKEEEPKQPDQPQEKKGRMPLEMGNPVENPVASTPVTVAPAPVAFVPLNTPALGSRLGGGGGGGSEEVAPEPKKTNWLLPLLIVGGLIYFATRKSN